MTPSEVSKTDSVCRFIPKDEWDEDRDEPMPSVFKASNRQFPYSTKRRSQTLATACETCALVG